MQSPAIFIFPSKSEKALTFYDKSAIMKMSTSKQQIGGIIYGNV